MFPETEKVQQEGILSLFTFFVTVFWQVYFAELWKKCRYALKLEYRMVRKQ